MSSGWIRLLSVACIQFCFYRIDHLSNSLIIRASQHMSSLSWLIYTIPLIYHWLGFKDNDPTKILGFIFKNWWFVPEHTFLCQIHKFCLEFILCNVKFFSFWYMIPIQSLRILMPLSIYEITLVVSRCIEWFNQPKCIHTDNHHTTSLPIFLSPLATTTPNFGPC